MAGKMDILGIHAHRLAIPDVKIKNVSSAVLSAGSR
jgi:hypothetical protein